MEITLTIKNCHRAKTVRPVNNPEAPEHEFGWRKKLYEQGMFSCRFNHIITAPDGSEIEVSDLNLKEWVVISWKYEENMEHLWSAGVNAFYNTSHSPEERAAQAIREFEKELQDDLANIPADEKEAYAKRYTEWVSILFAKHSRIASAMIVGPAKFPTRRNESASNAYDHALKEFGAWREKALKRIQQKIEDAKPQEQKDDEEWQAVRAQIMDSAGSIFAIDTQNAPYSRPLFVSNLYGRMETLAKRGKVELLKKAAELVRELNEKFKAKGGKEIFTSRHKFWKLVEAAEAEMVKKAERADLEDIEIEFEGGTIILAFSEDRLQIHHDTKPSPDVIQLLKTEAWRWSRNNCCWQRQLTRNACYSAARVIIGGPKRTCELDEITNYAQMLCQNLPA